MNRVFIILFLLSLNAFAAVGEIVAEHSTSSLNQVPLYRELKVFKDPNVFLKNVALLYVDPKVALENMKSEDFFLTTLAPGVHKLVVFEPPQELRDFVTIASLMEHYQRIEPRLRSYHPHRIGTPSLRTTTKITHIMIGSGGYNGYLGFVLTEDFERAKQQQFARGQLPPSVGADDSKIIEMTRRLRAEEPTEVSKNSYP